MEIPEAAGIDSIDDFFDSQPVQKKKHVLEDEEETLIPVTENDIIAETITKFAKVTPRSFSPDKPSLPIRIWKNMKRMEKRSLIFLLEKHTSNPEDRIVKKSYLWFLGELHSRYPVQKTKSDVSFQLLSQFRHLPLLTYDQIQNADNLHVLYSEGKTVEYNQNRLIEKFAEQQLRKFENLIVMDPVSEKKQEYKSFPMSGDLTRVFKKGGRIFTTDRAGNKVYATVESKHKIRIEETNELITPSDWTKRYGNTNTANVIFIERPGQEPISYRNLMATPVSQLLARYRYLIRSRQDLYMLEMEKQIKSHGKSETSSPPVSEESKREEQELIQGELSAAGVGELDQQTNLDLAKGGSIDEDFCHRYLSDDSNPPMIITDKDVKIKETHILSFGLAMHPAFQHYVTSDYGKALMKYEKSMYWNDEDEALAKEIAKHKKEKEEAIEIDRLRMKRQKDHENAEEIQKLFQSKNPSELLAYLQRASRSAYLPAQFNEINPTVAEGGDIVRISTFSLEAFQDWYYDNIPEHLQDSKYEQITEVKQFITTLKNDLKSEDSLFNRWVTTVLHNEKIVKPKRKRQVKPKDPNAPKSSKRLKELQKELNDLDSLKDSQDVRENRLQILSLIEEEHANIRRKEAKAAERKKKREEKEKAKELDEFADLLEGELSVESGKEEAEPEEKRKKRKKEKKKKKEKKSKKSKKQKKKVQELPDEEELQPAPDPFAPPSNTGEDMFDDEEELQPAPDPFAPLNTKEDLFDDEEELIPAPNDDVFLKDTQGNEPSIMERIQTEMLAQNLLNDIFS